MDEKHAPMPPPIRRGFSPLRLLIATGYLALAAFTYWQFTAGTVLFRPSASRAPSRQQVAIANELVPLEAHIMSKCPDSKVGRLFHLSLRR
jgi:hypothetical protein